MEIILSAGFNWSYMIKYTKNKFGRMNAVHKAKVLAKLPNLIKPWFVLLSIPKRHKPTALPLASFFIFRFSMLASPCK